MVFKAIKDFISSWNDWSDGINVGAFDEYPSYLDEYCDLVTEHGQTWTDLSLEADLLVQQRGRGREELAELAQCVDALAAWTTELNDHAEEFTSSVATPPTLPKRILGDDTFRRDLLLKRWRAKCGTENPPGRPRKAMIEMFRLMTGFGVIVGELGERVFAFAVAVQDNEDEDILSGPVKRLRRSREKLSVWLEGFVQYSRNFVPEYPAWMHILLPKKVGE